MQAVSLDEVRQWDKQDPLRHHRDTFSLPDGVIYLDGNSLGPLPHATAERMAHVINKEWGRGLIRSWTDAAWMEAPGRVGAKIARLVGAQPHEVTVADSTSVNLFKIAAAAAALRPDRTTLLTEADNFPTDRHVLDGLARLVPGMRVVAVPAGDILGMLGPDTAALVLCHVHYRSGARHDMAAFSAAAHRAGALSLWDISHSAGAIPVQLNAEGADMAIGCGYKFLNGGPGAPGFLYVAERHQAQASSPVQGWIGHRAPFGFADVYQPADGVRRFLSGTPAVLGLAALECGVDAFLQVDADLVWKKSAKMFNLFSALAAPLSPYIRQCTSPVTDQRGSHISFTCVDAEHLMSRLIKRGVIGDFRPSDILRFGITPLYTRYEDIWSAVSVLRSLTHP